MSSRSSSHRSSSSRSHHSSRSSHRSSRESSKRRREDSSDRDREKKRKDEKETASIPEPVENTNSEEAKERELKELEDAMEKRRLRVKAWQEQQNSGTGAADGAANNNPNQLEEGNTKSWSLEDDEEEDTESNKAAPALRDTVMKEAKPSSSTTENGNAANEDEADPLDMFMQGVQEEVQKLNNAESTGKNVIVKRKLDISTEGAKKGKEGEIYFDQDVEEPEVVVESDGEDDELWSRRAKKRELQQVDHSKQNYIEFRKKFYIEVPEITAMTDQEVEEYRVRLDNITIRGKGAPRPIKNFHQCGLNDRILDVLEKKKYSLPTPIQAQAIPTIMIGRDVIGIAKTGSGKTLSYLLPMLRHILDQEPVKPGDGPIGIIIAPTRELVTQIAKEAKSFCKALQLTCVPIYGGAGVAHQIGDLKRGCEIVVCTPGRMIDILCTNAGRVTNLRRVSFLVLDEADRMFDMGFEPQITKIIDGIRPDRQTVLFSATFPKSVEMAARKVLKLPIEITVGGRSIVCDDVDQHIEIREEHTKFPRLLELLGEWFEKGSVLIFVERQQDADNLFKELLVAKYPSVLLHGGQDQTDRASSLSDFKKGDVTIMVATSLAARGLDVPSLKLVVNYDCPNHYEDYVHRCGRTGRAGRKGTSYTFITPDQEEYSPDLVKALELSNRPVPEALAKMAVEYEKKKKEGKAVKTHGGGFGGKGFKFNAEEEARKMMAQKMLRLGYGEVQNEEEEEEIEKLKEVTQKQREDREKAKKDRLIAGMMRSENKGPTTSEPRPTVPAVELDPAIAAARRKAKELAAKIDAARGRTPAAEAPSTVHQAELEINDYPQNARWKVTHKDSLSEILEFTGCAITARGTYVPQGKQPPPGERKLYLLIEGPSERAVWSAKNDIKKLLQEYVEHQNNNMTAPGRYNVLG